MLVQAAVGVVALVALRLVDGPVSGVVGLVAGTCAAPVLLLVGAPFADSGLYPAAVGLSAVLWLLVGFVAARRATRNPMAIWNDYWRHFGWLCAGVWGGATAALGLAALTVSDSIF